jgi:hypothetical protein
MKSLLRPTFTFEATKSMKDINFFRIKSLVISGVLAFSSMGYACDEKSIPDKSQSFDQIDLLELTQEINSASIQGAKPYLLLVTPGRKVGEFIVENKNCNVPELIALIKKAIGKGSDFKLIIGIMQGHRVIDMKERDSIAKSLEDFLTDFTIFDLQSSREVHEK